MTFVGDGPDRRRLEALCKRLALDDQVVFKGRILNAANLMAQHRVLVHSAIMESFGIVLIEAMARGLPVVAAPVGGVSEVFRDGKEGLSWSLDDPAEGARKLTALLDNKRYYDIMSAAAITRFEKKFCSGKLARQLYDFLTKSNASAPS